jgi:hypothetical protein
MTYRFEFNVKPRRGIVQFVIERDDKLLCLDLTLEELDTLIGKSANAYQAMDDYDKDEPDQYNREPRIH